MKGTVYLFLVCLISSTFVFSADFSSINSKNFPLWSKKVDSWKAQSDKIKTIDFIGKTERSVIARGSEGAEFRQTLTWGYNAHPTTALLSDGTIVATTYESIKEGEGCSITCHRFKMQDIEKLAK